MFFLLATNSDKRATKFGDSSQLTCSGVSAPGGDTLPQRNSSGGGTHVKVSGLTVKM